MNDLESLIVKLKDCDLPLEIILKAFFFGYLISYDQAKKIKSILRNRRVDFVSITEGINKIDNEYLDWISNEDKQELSNLINQLNKLDKKIVKHNYFKDIKYLIIKNKNKIKSDHKNNPYDLKYYFNYLHVIKSVKDNKFVIKNCDDLKELHKMLFDDGKFSQIDNHIYQIHEDGSKKTICDCAKADIKADEVNKAFSLYEDALSKNSDFAIIYEICLIVKLFRIHPFVDGNGRTLRLMLLIRLYMLGYKNIINISIEYLKLQYQYNYLNNCDVRIAYNKNKDVVQYDDPIYYHDFDYFIIKLLIVAYQGKY